MAKKDKKKKRLLDGSDIGLAILAALGGSVAFMTAVAIVGSIMFPDPGRVTAEAPSVQPSYRGTLPSRAPTKAPEPDIEESIAPTETDAPEPTQTPSEAVPDTPAPAQSQAPAPARTQAPAPSKAPTPTRAPTPTPSRTPAAQNPGPVVSISPTAPPARQTQAPAQSGNQSGNSSGDWGESSITNEITGDLGRTAYWTNGGRSYHFNRNCPSLSNSRNVNQGTLQDALNAGKTDPCNNCAGGS